MQVQRNQVKWRPGEYKVQIVPTLMGGQFLRVLPLGDCRNQGFSPTIGLTYLRLGSWFQVTANQAEDL